MCVKFLSLISFLIQPQRCRSSFRPYTACNSSVFTMTLSTVIIVQSINASFLSFCPQLVRYGGVAVIFPSSLKRCWFCLFCYLRFNFVAVSFLSFCTSISLQCRFCHFAPQFHLDVISVIFPLKSQTALISSHAVIAVIAVSLEAPFFLRPSFSASFTSKHRLFDLQSLRERSEVDPKIGHSRVSRRMTKFCRRAEKCIHLSVFFFRLILSFLLFFAWVCTSARVPFPSFCNL